jgi:hypothetical protein
MFAARTGLSKRNAARYLDIVTTPMEVQEAFEAQKLNLVEASRVAHLLVEQQKAIAEGIRAGDEPRKLVKTFSTSNPWPEKALSTNTKHS